MKKSIIASVIVLGMVSGLAHAEVPGNEVQFHGRVNTVSCNLVPSVNGSLLPNGGGAIELGDVGVKGSGQIVNFAFKPAQDTQNIAACDQLAGTTGKTVDLTWRGDKFGSSGLGAVSGEAVDSHVEITPVNSTSTSASFIKASGEKNTFNASVLKSGTGEGLEYQAVLKGGNTPGEFNAAATFNLIYN
ncbi:fimbrial protein PefA [Escherichia coli]|uniref:hypothetical protein n=1 Tax=Escherichia coli TaxID=562 RepID=UPI00191AA1B4|nr:hypothetical protein [Escherichia coli]CAD5756796.1 fimbrial protein PefA [Escherichia coli]